MQEATEYSVKLTMKALPHHVANLRLEEFDTDNSRFIKLIQFDCLSQPPTADT